MTKTGLRAGVGSSRLAVAFLAILLPPAVTLIWLGWTILDQDKTLSAQRAAERRQSSAETVVASLDRSLAEAERWLSGGEIPEGALRVAASSAGVRLEPAGRTLWVPEPPADPEAADSPFTEAETLEFRGSAEKAAGIYQKLAHSGDAPVRAGALLRLARVSRGRGQRAEALGAYRSLAAVHGVSINGMPADLWARRAQCDLLESGGMKQQLAREASALAADFANGRWILDRPGWTMAQEDLARWTGGAMPISADRKTLSAAAERIWGDWRDGSQALSGSGRRVIDVGGVPVTVVWRRDAQAYAAVALLPTVLEGWLQDAVRRTGGAPIRIALMAESGQFIAGNGLPLEGAAVKLATAETRLPWVVGVRSVATAADTRDVVLRERLFAAGLAAIVLLLAGGSWWLWHVMRREFVVARLQADFVSAVSHEFRTPLTALQHVTELLEEDDDLPPERRKSFYSSLERNNQRLRRLVESLLDFGRMESGRKPYDLRAQDAGAIVAQTVADFGKEAGPRGFAVNMDRNGGGELLVEADRVALTHALWNVLDNAVKYSGESRSIWVSVGRHEGEIAINVRDLGLGVPARERKEIFRKFVRGEEAKRLGIKGTGLGLALVSHIMEAHGGRIELESEEGRGSTFRLSLPARE